MRRALHSAVPRIPKRMTTINDAAAAEARALAEDAADPLAPFRDEFLIPRNADDSEQAYFCGNSLGLQPRATRQALADELDDWQTLAVEAHFRGKHPWMPYHEFVREDLAAVVGALPSEVVAMNSLTVNLHLMMVSFYRPTAERPAILIEKTRFRRIATRSNRRSASTASIRRRR